MIEPSTAIEIAKGGHWFFDKLKPQLKKIQTRITKGNLNFLIIGASGVGKTTLQAFLGKNKGLKPPEQTYGATFIGEDVSFNGALYGKVYDSAGQENSPGWVKALTQLEKGEINCLIYVLAGGYHSLRTYDEDTHLESYPTLEDYLESKRETEIRLFNEYIAPRLMKVKANFYLITLVLKEDLWWKDKEDIKKFYAKSEMNANIEKIRAINPNFLHENIHMSLQHENLRFGRDHIESKTCEGYDIWAQYKGFEDLEAAMARLCQLKRN